MSDTDNSGDYRLIVEGQRRGTPLPFHALRRLGGTPISAYNSNSEGIHGYLWSFPNENLFEAAKIRVRNHGKRYRVNF